MIHSSLYKSGLNGLLRSVVVLFAFVLAGLARARDHTILFSVTDPGVTASITNWGLDTCWPNYDNMLRGLLFMDANNVNLVNVHSGRVFAS